MSQRMSRKNLQRKRQKNVQNVRNKRQKNVLNVKNKKRKNVPKEKQKLGRAQVQYLNSEVN